MSLVNQYQELILESRRIERGLFAERILTLQKKANFELMSIVYDILHKPMRIRVKDTNQVGAAPMLWEDALRDACTAGDTSIDILLDCDYEFFLKNATTPPDKVNILTGVYSVFDVTRNGYVEFSDAPMLIAELASKLNENFILRCEEFKFNKTATLHIEVPLSAS